MARNPEVEHIAKKLDKMVQKKNTVSGARGGGGRFWEVLGGSGSCSGPCSLRLGGTVCPWVGAGARAPEASARCASVTSETDLAREVQFSS